MEADPSYLYKAQVEEGKGRVEDTGEQESKGEGN